MSRSLKVLNLEDLMNRAEKLTELVLDSDVDIKIKYEAHELMSRIMTHKAIHDYKEPVK
jgi:hypothetical protein